LVTFRRLLQTKCLMPSAWYEKSALCSRCFPPRETYLGGICNGFALGNLRFSRELFEKVGDGEDAIGALEGWRKSLGLVQVGLKKKKVWVSTG
jgi:hypothetical protein